MTASTTKRVATQDTHELPLAKKFKSPQSYNPLEIKPLGNLFLNPTNRTTRSNGLGNLAMLPDELLLSEIFSQFDGKDMILIAGVSKAFFAWSFLEGLWKGIYITESSGRLLEWNGSWRSSYISTFIRPSTTPLSTPLPTKGITTSELHSDVLFQPALSAAFNPRPLFLSNSFVPTINKIDGRNLTPQDLPSEPVILQHVMDNWAAMDISGSSGRRWTLPTLSKRFSNVLFRAEATLTTLPHYETYHDKCEMDESPLYLFESEFVEKTIKDENERGLGDDYTVPECFREDLFEVMGSSRPDYRWLIAGPSRSGSTWHCDPNSTSAWNAVTVGSKAWVCFPPGITPPGVHVSADLAEVSAPLSLAEWFISYYKEAKAIYGAKGVEGKKGLMREGICNAGEIFFVPSGWWHINLEPAIAVTQNFVSRRELPSVLKFMRDRPEQVSGFKLAKSTTTVDEPIDGLQECDEVVAGVFEAFIEALKREKGDMAAEALESLEREDAVKEKEVGEKISSIFTGGDEGFSFGFVDAGDEDEDYEVLDI